MNDDLPELRAHIRSQRPALAGFLEDAGLGLAGDSLRVIPGKDIYIGYLNDNRDAIGELASELYGRKLRVEVWLNGNGTAPQPPAAEMPAESDSSNPRPTPRFRPDLDNIPSELTVLSRWVLWRYEWRLNNRGDGEWTKPPYQPDGTPASSTNPATWSSFNAVRVAYEAHRDRFDGVGFVLDGSGRVAWDFDHVVGAEEAISDEKVAGYVRTLDSYCEVSPSGTGLRVLVFGRLPPKDRKIGNIECYETERYVTITGRHVPNTPQRINERQDAINVVHAEAFAERIAKRAAAEAAPRANGTAKANNLDDGALLDKARRAKNGERFSALYDRGDWKTLGFASPSEADLALCSMLAFWCGADKARVDQLFRTSGLTRPKWEGRADYRERTLEAATATCTETYESRNWQNNMNGGGSAKAKDSGEGEKHDSGNADGTYRGDGEGAKPAAPWPAPLDRAAFHGPAGRFVDLMAPHTEADEAALLAQFLISFGNVIGRGVYREAEGARHYPNLFGVLVGETGRGRKGSSFARVRSGLESVVPEWASKNIAGGMSSGEGLIWAVRDSIETTIALKEKGRFTGEFQTAITDDGVKDKRLLVVEAEFARVLKSADRDGNTLSQVIRHAWDTGNLQIMTKNSPARATDAHISIIGHITDEELARNLHTTEAANGFANRILWFCSKRSKLLPRGGRPDQETLNSFFATLQDAIDWASITRELDFSEAAWVLWDTVYPTLTAARPGLLGAVLGRAEAQTLRLAVLYAGLDCSPTIELEHLRAALGIWEYVEASIEYVFGDRLGDPDADAIFEALRAAPQGLTRTQISELFSHHLSAARLQRALGVLLKHRLAGVTRIETGGRPTELWSSRSAE